MRSSLPNARPNGHVPPPPEVFVITGMCEDPHFKLHGVSGDVCSFYFGAPGLKLEIESADDPGTLDLEEEPYFILRRSFEGGAAVVGLRIDWEGVFTILANDDTYAEQLYNEILKPGCPMDVVREWSTVDANLEMFTEWLTVG